MKTARKVTALLLALLMLLSLAACGPSTSDPSAPAGNSQSAGNKNGGDGPVTLTVGAQGYAMDGCDPRQSRNMLLLYGIYDTLFYHDYSSGKDELKGLLAESSEYIDNGDGTWKFHVTLRQGCKFASGEELTAADVLATWQHMFEMGIGAQHPYLNIEQSYTEGDYDVYFFLNAYEPEIMHYMSLFTFSIVNDSYWDTATDEQWWDQPDESGAFELVEMESGSHVLLKVRDDYWGWGVIQERPKYDEMMIYYYSEASTMMVDYETGRLDVCLNIAANDIQRVSGGGIENTTMRQLYGGGVIYLVMNTSSQYLKDAKVREAVRYAVDFQGAFDVSVGVTGKIANGFIPEGGLYRVDYGVPEHNVDKAKALLAEAGYPNGMDMRIVVSNADMYTSYAEVLQSCLGEAGINLTIESYDPATVLTMQRDGDCDLTIYSFSGNVNFPTETFTQMLSTSLVKCAAIVDGAIDQLYTTGRYSMDEAESEKAVRELQETMHTGVYGVPLCQLGYAVLYRDSVNGERIGNVGIHGVADLRFLDLK